MSITQPELNKLQVNILQVFKKIDSQETVTSVARHLKLEAALAKSMLDKLAELSYLRLKHVGTSQLYVMLPAGVNYLRQMVNAPAVQSSTDVLRQQQDEALNLLKAAGSFGLSAKAAAEKMQIDRVVASSILQSLVKAGSVKRWANGVYHIPATAKPAAPEDDKAEPANIPPREKGTLEKAYTATSAPTVGQLQDERLKALRKSLAELGEKIKYPPQILIPDYELKQEVLQRLADFFEDSISNVLTDIRTDLQNIHTFNSGVQQ